MVTLKEINRRNGKFWEEQNRLRNQSVQDTLLVRLLETKLNSPQYRLIPAARASVEQLLEEAAREQELVLACCEPLIRQQTLRQQARNAGRSKRPDALQLLIVELVRGDPQITSPQVFKKLQAIPPPSPVVEVDEGVICYENGPGKALKNTHISGLKDRVSRARKFLNSR